MEPENSIFINFYYCNEFDLHGVFTIEVFMPFDLMIRKLVLWANILLSDENQHHC